MAGHGDDYFSDFFAHSLAACERASKDPQVRTAVDRIATTIQASFDNGGKLLILGNGGSAAHAQHLAAEFLSRYAINREPLPAIALTTDTSVLTAIGNDFDFDQVFERQVRALGQPHDVLLAISTSGLSKNVIAALRAARAIGMATVGFTGQTPREMGGLCDLCLLTPTSDTAIIQQIHLIAGHVICGLVERSAQVKRPSR